MLAYTDLDPSSAGAAGILEQLVENVGDRPVEQARYLRDEFIADRWANLAGKRHDRISGCRATSSLPHRPAPPSLRTPRMRGHRSVNMASPLSASANSLLSLGFAIDLL